MSPRNEDCPYLITSMLRRSSFLALLAILTSISGCATARDKLVANHVTCLTVPGVTARQFLVGGYHLPLDIGIELGPNLKAAVDASGTIVFESYRTGSSQERETIAKAARRIDQLDPPLSSVLDQELDDALRAASGGEVVGWRSLSPIDLWLLLSKLIGASAQAPPSEPDIDQLIRSYGISKGKPLGRLETPAEQYRLLTTVPSTRIWDNAFRKQLNSLNCQSCAAAAAIKTRDFMTEIIDGNWTKVRQLADSKDWSDAELHLAVSKVRDPILASRILNKSRSKSDRSSLFVIGGAHVLPVLERLREASVEVEERCSVAAP